MRGIKLPDRPSAEDRLEIRRIMELCAGVEGWLRGDEAAFLYMAARAGPGDGLIVEIGSWKGKSTVSLASGSKATGREKVYAIDPHTGSAEHGEGIWTFPEFKRTIEAAGVSDHVVPMIMSSEEVAAGWSQPIRLLWIDGAHEYDAVKRDFDLWELHLIDGGIIALHDTIGHFAGPKRVATRDVLRSGRFKDCGIVGITTYGQKASIISAGDWVRNYMVLVERTLLEVAGRR